MPLPQHTVATLAVGVLSREAAEPPQTPLTQIGRANAPDANLQPLGRLR